MSRAHRDRPAAGCPISALANDVSHTDPTTRAIYTAGVRAAIDHLAALLDDDTAAAAALSAAVGAIAMSRAVDDAELSDHILHATRTHLRTIPRDS